MAVLMPAPNPILFTLLTCLSASIKSTLGQLEPPRFDSPPPSGLNLTSGSGSVPRFLFTTVNSGADQSDHSRQANEDNESFDVDFNDLQKRAIQKDDGYSDRTERISHSALDKYECGDRHKVCDYDESCERLCFWDEYTKQFIGCKVACVKQYPRVKLLTYKSILPLPYKDYNPPTGGRRPVPRAPPPETYDPRGVHPPHPPHGGPYDYNNGGGNDYHDYHDYDSRPQHPRPHPQNFPPPAGHFTVSRTAPGGGQPQLHSHNGGPPHTHPHPHHQLGPRAVLSGGPIAPAGRAGDHGPGGVPGGAGPVLPDSAYHNTCSSTLDCNRGSECCYYRQCGYVTRYDHEHECTVTKRCLHSCQPHPHNLPFVGAKAKAKAKAKN